MSGRSYYYCDFSFDVKSVTTISPDDEKKVTKLLQKIIKSVIRSLPASGNVEYYKTSSVVKNEENIVLDISAKFFNEMDRDNMMKENTMLVQKIQQYNQKNSFSDSIYTFVLLTMSDRNEKMQTLENFITSVRKKFETFLTGPQENIKQDLINLISATLQNFRNESTDNIFVGKVLERVPSSDIFKVVNKYVDDEENAKMITGEFYARLMCCDDDNDFSQTRLCCIYSSLFLLSRTHPESVDEDFIHTNTYTNKKFEFICRSFMKYFSEFSGMAVFLSSNPKSKKTPANNMQWYDVVQKKILKLLSLGEPNTALLFFDEPSIYEQLNLVHPDYYTDCFVQSYDCRLFSQKDDSFFLHKPDYELLHLEYIFLLIKTNNNVHAIIMEVGECTSLVKLPEIRVFDHNHIKFKKGKRRIMLHEYMLIEDWKKHGFHNAVVVGYSRHPQRLTIKDSRVKLNFRSVYDTFQKRSKMYEKQIEDENQPRKTFFAKLTTFIDANPILQVRCEKLTKYTTGEHSLIKDEDDDLSQTIKAQQEIKLRSLNDFLLCRNYREYGGPSSDFFEDKNTLKQMCQMMTVLEYFEETKHDTAITPSAPMSTAQVVCTVTVLDDATDKKLNNLKELAQRFINFHNENKFVDDWQFPTYSPDTLAQPLYDKTTNHLYCVLAARETPENPFGYLTGYVLALTDLLTTKQEKTPVAALYIDQLYLVGLEERNSMNIPRGMYPGQMIDAFVHACDTKTAFLRPVDGPKRLLANTDNFPIAEGQEVVQDGLTCCLDNEEKRVQQGTELDIYAMVIKKNIHAQLFFLRGAQYSFSGDTIVKKEEDLEDEAKQITKLYQFAPSLSFQAKSYLQKIDDELEDCSVLNEEEKRTKRQTVVKMLEEIQCNTKITNAQKNMIHWKSWGVRQKEPQGTALDENSVLYKKLKEKVEQTLKTPQKISLEDKDMDDEPWPDSDVRTLTLNHYAKIERKNGQVVYFKPTPQTFQSNDFFKRECDEQDMIIVHSPKMSAKKSVIKDAKLLQRVLTNLETLECKNGKLKQFKTKLEELSKNFATKNIDFLADVQMRLLEKNMPIGQEFTKDETTPNMDLFVDIWHMMKTLSCLNDIAEQSYLQKWTILENNAPKWFQPVLKERIKKLNEDLEQEIKESNDARLLHKLMPFAFT